MMWLKFRASGIAPLFAGTDGLTDAQLKRISELQNEKDTGVNTNGNKVKWTDNKDAELKDLKKRKSDFDNGIVELPAGAKTYVESLVDQHVYQYKPTFGDRKTEKGNRVENDAIDVVNNYFMSDYKKSETHLEVGNNIGHPDIEDEEDLMIADLKCPWSKETFPKLPEQISNSTYEWQIKDYLYMKLKMTGKPWRKGRLIYVLMSTPEDLVPDYEGDDLHYVDDLDLRLRVTYVDYELTDENIAHMERRLSAALIYAEEYYNKLMQKCSN